MRSRRDHVPALLLCICLVAGYPFGGAEVRAEGPGDDAAVRAQAAFDDRDYARAEALWSIGAKRGDPEGLAGLALLRDGGYGRPRDLTGAFDLYLRAARAGLTRAQFNVAVMSDAGIGTPRNPREAAIWYTRAALRGHGRAQYNLGLLTEAGTVGPSDPARAAFWYAIAGAQIPSAADRLDVIGSPDAGDADGVAPVLLFAAREAGSLELVWAPDGSGDAVFEVEMLPVPDDGAEYRADAMTIETSATGLLVVDPAPGERLAVRVLRRDASARDYASSGWMADAGPVGRVAIRMEGGATTLLPFAEAIGADLRAAGIWVATGEPPSWTRPGAIPAGGSDTRVVYGWRPDRALADATASLLPGASREATFFDPFADLLPGEVALQLGTER